jgi:hypothetical protein
MTSEETASARARTVDPLIKSQLLYQLSYRGLLNRQIFVREVRGGCKSSPEKFVSFRGSDFRMAG